MAFECSSQPFFYKSIVSIPPKKKDGGGVLRPLGPSPKSATGNRATAVLFIYDIIYTEMASSTRLV